MEKQKNSNLLNEQKEKPSRFMAQYGLKLTISKKVIAAEKYQNKNSHAQFV